MFPLLLLFQADQLRSNAAARFDERRNRLFLREMGKSLFDRGDGRSAVCVPLQGKFGAGGLLEDIGTKRPQPYVSIRLQAKLQGLFRSRNTCGSVFGEKGLEECGRRGSTFPATKKGENVRIPLFQHGKNPVCILGRSLLGCNLGRIPENPFYEEKRERARCQFTNIRFPVVKSFARLFQALFKLLALLVERASRRLKLLFQPFGILAPARESGFKPGSFLSKVRKSAARLFRFFLDVFNLFFV